MDLLSRLKNAWNAFSSEEDYSSPYQYPKEYDDLGISSFYRQDRIYSPPRGDKTIITPIYNRIAMDVCSYDIRHVKLDEKGRYKEDVPSGLNKCLNFGSNKDQISNSFILDLVMSMFSDGYVAAVPIDTTGDIYKSDNWDILSLRVGKILEWFPDYVKVEVYNDRSGKRENLTVAKENTAIIENPLYSVMNEHNSTGKRLLRKLSLLDAIDEQSSSGKLDLIIQLPYVVRSDARKKEAANRAADMVSQLSGSKYGIAYTDGTEKITQLNRPVENNLLAQVQYLNSMLFSQLGVTSGVLDGTADSNTMNNYRVRSINPILNAITKEFKRKFLSKTAISQNQSIMYFSSPIQFMSPAILPDFADKMLRNEVMSPNEVRETMGLPPSGDPNSDILKNRNMGSDQTVPNVNSQNQKGVTVGNLPVEEK